MSHMHTADPLKIWNLHLHAPKLGARKPYPSHPVPLIPRRKHSKEIHQSSTKFSTGNQSIFQDRQQISWWGDMICTLKFVGSWQAQSAHHHFRVNRDLDVTWVWHDPSVRVKWRTPGSGGGISISLMIAVNSDVEVALRPKTWKRDFPFVFVLSYREVNNHPHPWFLDLTNQIDILVSHGFIVVVVVKPFQQHKRGVHTFWDILHPAIFVQCML